MEFHITYLEMEITKVTLNDIEANIGYPEILNF